MKRIIALICTFACVAMLAGCGCNSKQSEDETTTVKTPQNSISVVPADSTETKAPEKKTIIVTPVPTQKPTKKLSKKESKKEAKKQVKKQAESKKTKATGGDITGSWTFEGGIFVYTFKKDGTGVYTTGSDAMYFTYKKNGNKVIIKYKDGPKVTMPYSVKNKTLLLKDENGDDMPYYKNNPKAKPKK